MIALGGAKLQRFQRWKPSSSQPRLVGKLAFVTVMMCAALPQRSQRWKAYFPQPRPTGSGLVCLCWFVVTALDEFESPALPALKTLFLPAQVQRASEFVTVVIRGDCTG